MGIAQVASGWGAMLTAVESGPPDETIDPNGARVVLSDALWHEKIVRDHAEIAAYRAEVLQAVSAPRSCGWRPELRAPHAVLHARRGPEPLAAGHRKL